MVYDCFIFNDELDLLELRLRYLDHAVDRFVLVESARTLAGKEKPLYYQQARQRFSEFQHKIIHVVAPVNNLEAWDYEYFQRNYIKEGLQECQASDIVFISDADEIINIPAVLALPGLQFPALVEIPMCYYYLNVQTTASYWVNLVATADMILTTDIGRRNEGYPLLAKHKIGTNECLTGWHFSYCYGNDIKKYQEKLQSFSHQEYNTPYYLNAGRIQKCISLLVDLFERSFMNLTVENGRIEPLLPYVRNSRLATKLYSKEKAPNKLLPGNLFFILRKKYFPKIKRRLGELFLKKTDS